MLITLAVATTPSKTLWLKDSPPKRVLMLSVAFLNPSTDLPHILGSGHSYTCMRMIS